MEKISVIVPCWNEEEALPVYYQEMRNVMNEMNTVEFELFFVDDGSTDGTLARMRELCRRDRRCRYLSFSRNFGKEAAMYAGFSNARGDYVAVMDADLQDPPALLPEMYRILQEEDCDSVAARRSTRQGEPWLRSRLSQCFYGIANRILKTQIVSGARDYRLMNRKMVDAILGMQEYSRFTKGMFGWVGFRTRWLEFENVERCAGQTKWSLPKLFRYAAEGIGGFSTAPLFLAPILGMVLCMIAGLLVLGNAAVVLMGGKGMSGALLLAPLILLIGGIQLVCSGISAWYLSKTYLETKRRPVYILQESSEEIREEQQKPFAAVVPVRGMQAAAKEAESKVRPAGVVPVCSMQIAAKEAESKVRSAGTVPARNGTGSMTGEENKAQTAIVKRLKKGSQYETA